MKESAINPEGSQSAIRNPQSVIRNPQSAITMWESYKKGFKAYLQLEKSLAENSVEAYLTDIEKLTAYLQTSGNMKTPADIQLQDLQQFIQWAAELGLTASSQARMISGIRQF